MSQDAYSPISGRWGVAGIWDVVALGLAVAVLVLMVLVLARTRRDRLIAVIAAALLVPAYFGIGWLAAVQIEGPDGDSIDCLMRGPVDVGSPCGAAYLDRYAALVIPLTLLLIALACLVVVNVRSLIRNHRAKVAVPEG